jgi:Domain of unknown function (DUF6458)
MTVAASLFLIAVGAILKYAVTADVAGIDLQVVGVILMIVGAVGLVLGLVLMERDRSSSSAQDHGRVHQRVGGRQDVSSGQDLQSESSSYSE